MGDKILVMRLDHLGDVVLTTPLVRALAMSGREVTVVVPKAWVSVFDHNPHAAAVHGLEDICPGFPKEWRALASWMRAGKFSAVVLPYANQKQQVWASFLSGTKTRVAMWSGLWGRLTLHRCVSSRLREDPRYFSDVVLDCARVLGIEPQGTTPELFLTDGELREARAMLAKRFGDRPVVGIHPGSAGNACNLPPGEYGEICRALLARTGAAVVITGSKKERPLIESWPAEVSASDRVWHSMGELSLRQLASIIRNLAVYICPSTGPLHLAAAQDIPTVSPFCAYSALSPQIWGNQHENAVSLSPGEEFCRMRRAQDPRNCDFCGKIPAERIVGEAMRFFGP